MATIILQTEIEKHKGIRYEVESTDMPIGEGGMGKVYKGVCVNERNGATRPVAIKFMYSDLPANVYEKARRESSIRLRNDNLIEMLGFIETQEEQLGEIRKHYHVVSELLTGVSLRDLFDGKTTDRDGNEFPFAVKMLQEYKNNPEQFAVKIVINVLSGLMALHDAGYIHRDIDPSNIMLTTDGHIKLIDFGIAKKMDSLAIGDNALTVYGTFTGKPEYAAPELAEGDLHHQNQRTDIYAVGILLYQCITGHTPFEGSMSKVLNLQKDKKIKVPLDRIKDDRLRKIIAKACDKDQNMRYATCAQMRTALEIGPTPSPIPKKAIAATAAVIILIVAGIVGASWYKNKEAEKQMEIEKIEHLTFEEQASIDKKIQEADNIFEIGKSKVNEDTYENDLIKAYGLFNEAETIAKNSQYSKEYRSGDIAEKKKQTMQAIDEALKFITEQMEDMKAIGSAETQFYEKRIVVITQFKNKQK